MSYQIVNAYRPPYTQRLRTKPISLIMIHATRGHTSQDFQDDATLNFFANPGDRGGWAPTADVLISSDDDRVYTFGDILHQHSAWSAGYGSYGPTVEWGADEHAISIELAQSDQQEPFSARTIDKLVWWLAQAREYWGLTFPPVRVGYWSQLKSEVVPRGFIGHEDTANGRKGGKSDPGYQFPWDEVLWRVAQQQRPPVPVAGNPPVLRLTNEELLDAYVKLGWGINAPPVGVDYEWGELTREDDGTQTHRLIVRGRQ